MAMNLCKVLIALFIPNASLSAVKMTKEQVSELTQKPLLKHLGTEPVYDVTGEVMTLNDLIEKNMKLNCDDPLEMCHYKFFQLVTDAYTFAVKNRVFKYLALLSEYGYNLLMSDWSPNEVLDILKHTMTQIDNTIQKEAFEKILIISSYLNMLTDIKVSDLSKLLLVMYNNFKNCIIPTFLSAISNDQLKITELEKKLYQSISTKYFDIYTIFNVPKNPNDQETRQVFETFRKLGELVREEHNLYGLVKIKSTDTSPSSQ